MADSQPSAAPLVPDRKGATPVPWYREVTPPQWKALLAAQLGWMLDGLDDDGRNRALEALRRSIAAHTEETGVLYASATWIIQAHTI